MGILIITAVIVVIFGVCYYYTDEASCIGCLLSVLVVGIMLSVCVNGDYCSEVEKESFTIGVIENVSSDNSAKYLSRDRDGSITYLKLNKDEKGNVTWKTEGIKQGEVVIIIENDNVLEPTLTLYEAGYMGNFWTFSLLSRNTTYVFRLPKTEALPIYESPE